MGVIKVYGSWDISIILYVRHPIKESGLDIPQAKSGGQPEKPSVDGLGNGG